MELESDRILPQIQFQLSPVANSAEDLPILLFFSACHRGKQEAQEREFHQGMQKIISTHYAGFHQQTPKTDADESKTESKEP